ncbi:TetR family transcriptional regulator, partial [cyanobacterium TDX16]
MAEEGVNGLSISEVARRLGVQPPSIYKYFPSLMAIFDALFERGMRTHLEVQTAAMTEAEPGLDALTKGFEQTGRWALANPALAQLLFWRPVPGFEPTARAMEPSI